MNIAIFDREPFSYMSFFLKNSFLKLDLNVEIYNWEDLSFSSYPFYIKYRNEKITLPKVLITLSRVYTRNTYNDLTLIKHFLESMENNGVYCFNPINPTMNSINKLFSSNILGKNQVSIPETASVKSIKEISYYINKWEDVIIKPAMGHGSIDVHRLIKKELWSDATTSINPFEEILIWELLQRYGVLCIQRFVEKVNYEYRLQVIDGEVVSAFDKLSSLNSWNSVDYLKNQTASPHIPSKLEINTAIKAVNSLNLNWATVDMVNTKDNEPFVIEVNPALSLWDNYSEVSYTCNLPIEEKIIESVKRKLAKMEGAI
ncbi:ATP-grasp domain-containing protein [Shouchella miscanthi]|uniref:ATP-grasp domain-containing protein n=1 Tax=Shouchella miscanthi TaxID=2598861 RepID=A0ABU6NEV1_9BACI|nr:ATP-grasp domain-containing protein [Shouchella miscanthi]MED4126730.1 ATP-grasp domain-containing protein [Shouchella miscanthi]